MFEEEGPDLATGVGGKAAHGPCSGLSPRPPRFSKDMEQPHLSNCRLETAG